MPRTVMFKAPRRVCFAKQHIAPRSSFGFHLRSRVPQILMQRTTSAAVWASVALAFVAAAGAAPVQVLQYGLLRAGEVVLGVRGHGFPNQFGRRPAERRSWSDSWLLGGGPVVSRWVASEWRLAERWRWAAERWSAAEPRRRMTGAGSRVPHLGGRLEETGRPEVLEHAGAAQRSEDFVGCVGRATAVGLHFRSAVSAVSLSRRFLSCGSSSG